MRESVSFNEGPSLGAPVYIVPLENGNPIIQEIAKLHTDEVVFHKMIKAYPMSSDASVSVVYQPKYFPIDKVTKLITSPANGFIGFTYDEELNVYIKCDIPSRDEQLLNRGVVGTTDSENIKRNIARIRLFMKKFETQYDVMFDNNMEELSCHRLLFILDSLIGRSGISVDYLSRNDIIELHRNYKRLRTHLELLIDKLIRNKQLDNRDKEEVRSRARDFMSCILNLLKIYTKNK